MAASGFPPLCNIPTAASRRSLDRVSVPVWLVILSDQLEIVGLVSLYLTNYLIPLGLILWQVARKSHPLIRRFYAVLATVSRSYPPSISQIPKHYSPVRHSSSKKQASLCYRSTCIVLSLPPAFNLSHDQTLQFKFNRSILLT